jgi:hypothetical protein
MNFMIEILNQIYNTFSEFSQCCGSLKNIFTYQPSQYQQALQVEEAKKVGSYHKSVVTLW